MLAKTLHFNHLYHVAVGEALGLFHALQWLQDMHFDSIDFELDSKVTRDALHSHYSDVYGIWKYRCCLKRIFLSLFP